MGSWTKTPMARCLPGSWNNVKIVLYQQTKIVLYHKAMARSSSICMDHYPIKTQGFPPLTTEIFAQEEHISMFSIIKIALSKMQILLFIQAHAEGNQVLCISDLFIIRLLEEKY